MVKTNGKANHEDLEDIKDIDEIFHFQRGDIKKNQGLRFRVKVPEGRKGRQEQQLTVSNIYDTKTNQHIRYGGQIADYVLMSVSASVIPKSTMADPIPCLKATASASESAGNSSFVAKTAEERVKGGPEMTYPLAKEAGRGSQLHTGDDYQG